MLFVKLKIKTMLANSKGFCSFSTNDIVKARQFYEGILGLKATEGMGGLVLDLEIKNSNPLVIYKIPHHKPANYTVFNFPVDNIEYTVASLKEKGVVFESYNTKKIKTDTDNIFRGGGPLIAWFKDPAGNILSIIEE